MLPNNQPEIKTFKVEDMYVQFYVNVHARLGWNLQNMNETVTGTSSSSFGASNNYMSGHANINTYPALRTTYVTGSGYNTGFQSSFGNTNVKTKVSLVFTRSRSFPFRNEIATLENKIWPVVDSYIASCREGRKNESLWTRANELIKEAESFSREDTKEYKAGLADIGIGDFSSALSHFINALRINPNDKNFLKGKADALRLDGQNDAAVEIYDQLLAQQPDNFEAMRGKALALSDLKALDYINKALKTVPKQDYLIKSLLKDKILICKKLKQLEDATKAQQDLIKYENKNPVLWVELSGLFKSQEKYKEAIKAIENAIKVEPHEFDYLREKGELYKLLKDYSRAIDAYTKALEVRPNDRLATVSLELCKTKKIYFDKNRKPFINNLMDSLLGKNIESEQPPKVEPVTQKPETTESIENSIAKTEIKQTQPEPVTVTAKLSTVNSAKEPDHTAKSITTTKQKTVNTTDSSTKSSQDQKKYVLWQARQEELSKAVIKEAKELYKQAEKLENKGDLAKSIELLTQANELNPYEPYYLDKLGWLYKEQKNFEKALVYYSSLTDIDEYRDDWQKKKIEMLCELKRYTDAEQILSWIESQESFTALFKKAVRARIYELKSNKG